MVIKGGNHLKCFTVNSSNFIFDMKNVHITPQRTNCQRATFLGSRSKVPKPVSKWVVILWRAIRVGSMSPQPTKHCKKSKDERNTSRCFGNTFCAYNLSKNLSVFLVSSIDISTQIVSKAHGCVFHVFFFTMCPLPLVPIE